MIKLIDESSYKYIMENQVESYLAQRVKSCNFSSFDGTELHYEQYESESKKACVVILHGFTESAEKFHEAAYYFLNEGYSVFSLDLRGHGFSGRKSKNPYAVSIESFDEYEKDLEHFIRQKVSPFAKDRPIYIYSHSLGSLAALLYLQKGGTEVEKAVLSSPMICGNMGMPVAVASAVARLLCAVGGKSIAAPGRCKFLPELLFKDSDATSEARFRYYHEKRITEPLYQTSGPTFDWVKASVTARDRVLKDENIKLIKAKLLIFKPEEDKQLLSSYLDLFAEKAGIVPITVAGSKHEIFHSENSVLEGYYKEIFDFFA